MIHNIKRWSDILKSGLFTIQPVPIDGHIRLECDGDHVADLNRHDLLALAHLCEIAADEFLKEKVAT